MMGSRIAGIAMAIAVIFVGWTTTAAEAQPICTNEFRPLCGLNPAGVRTTYSNDCFAYAGRAKKLHPGPCFGPFCTFLPFEVCAFDVRTRQLRTFANLCYAEIVNAVFVRNGRC